MVDRNGRSSPLPTMSGEVSFYSALVFPMATMNGGDLVFLTMSVIPRSLYGY